MRHFVKDVMEQACLASALGVAGEHSPAHDHQANGMVERAIREVKDQARVMHSALTAHVGALPLGLPVMDWMVEWAAEALTGARVGGDGMTAFRRL